MSTEAYLNANSLVDYISRWKPEDGRLIYIVSESFTADAPDIQKFDVNSSCESFISEKRAMVSRYTVGDITTIDQCREEIHKIFHFICGVTKDHLLFELTLPIMTIRVLVGSVQNINYTYYLVEQLEKNTEVDFTPYWKHILKLSIELGDQQFHNTTQCQPPEMDEIFIIRDFVAESETASSS